MAALRLFRTLVGQASRALGFSLTQGGCRRPSLLGFLPRRTDCSAASVSGLGQHFFRGAVFAFRVLAEQDCVGGGPC